MAEPNKMTIADVDRSYEALINSSEWNDAISDLNRYLLGALRREGLPEILNGNLFYGHRARDWAVGPYMEEFDDKRRNFHAMAVQSTNLLEIGVNGGHSMLLALMSNPELKVTGIDICERLGRDWAHVEVYGPAAFNWLRYHFPDRVTLIKGNSLLELPRMALQTPEPVYDSFHMDGSKDIHFEEFVSAMNMIKPNAFVVHDDINLRPVRRSDRRLRRIVLTQECDLASFGLRETVWQGIRLKV